MGSRAGSGETVIGGGIIVDGSGSPGREGSVRIVDGIIGEVHWGKLLPADAGGEFVDARGMVVCPGFIDVHGHSEFTLLADPRAESRIRQGVTTEIIGNCGLSAGPLEGDYRKHREADFLEYHLQDSWVSLGEYLRILEERRPTINVATLAGHGNVRGAVIGFSNRPATEAELNRMQRLLNRALQEGAIGFSAGLVYPPGVFGDTEELVALGRVVARTGGLFAFHMRSEGDELAGAVEEVLRVGETAGVHVHISHLKTAGEENWGKLDGVLRRIDQAQESGVRVSADRYPYTASSTDLDTVLSPDVFAGGKEAALGRLTDGASRVRILEQLRGSRWEGRWDRIMITGVGSSVNRWAEGRTVARISEEWGCPPPEAVLRLLGEEAFRVGAVFHVMNEENMRRILLRPDVCVGSDSAARGSEGPTATGTPHPRGFGTFARILGRYVREQGWFSLEEAVRRMSGLGAELFGLRGRGLIRESFHADLVVLDPERVVDRASYEKPFDLPDGIRDVWVNGVRALRGGEPTGDRAGRVLRFGR